MFMGRGQPGPQEARTSTPTTQSKKKPHFSDLAIQSNEWNIPPSDLAIQSNEWNVPLPPDLMYHIIDTYLDTFTIMALCSAFPVLPYRHITVYIHEARPRSHFIKIGLSKCPPTREQDNSILISTLDDLGYAGTAKARSVLSLISDLAHDLTSIHLNSTVKWNELDEYVKAYIFALLQRSGLCSVKLKYCDIPVNLLSVVQNLKTLDLGTSLGPPDKEMLSGERGKVYIEEVLLHYGVQDCLVGPGTPFNWSRLREIEYHSSSWNLQGLLKLCSSSLQVLEVELHHEGGEQLFTVIYS